MDKKHTLFVNKSNIIHNFKYKYIEEYKGSKIKIKILCTEHGEFEQTPNDHLNGKGCKKCGIIRRSIIRRKNNDDFIREANKKHNFKYEYPDKYIKSNQKFKILCPEHGEFIQEANSHLNGRGCPKCSVNVLDKQDFVREANKKHNFKYDYIDKYINSYTKIKIICPEHGEFKQIPSDHLLGSGCPKCVGRNLTTNDVINISNKKHNNYYCYDKTKFINNKTDIIIKCPLHGYFNQKPNIHMNGHGCSICNESKGEKKIRQILEFHSIKYISQKRFKDCRDKRPLPFDFYLPKLNMCIEFDGEQHFKIVESWGGEKGLRDRQRKDNIKTEFCKLNNIKLIRISYNDNINEKVNENLIYK